MSNIKRNERGFTLIETIIVAAIIAIVTAGAVVGTAAVLPGYRADQAMTQVASQLRSARQRAISQRHWVQVSFTGTNTMVFTDILLKGVAPQPTQVQFEGGGTFATVPGLPDTPMAFGNSAAIYLEGTPGGPPQMYFTSTGAFVDGGNNSVNGTVFLSVQGRPDTARAVTVMGATGRIRPYHYDGTQWQE
jgi:prepilin-type N-terminal cleavage/methylation domain-containing protein